MLFGHFEVFDHKFDKENSHLTKQNFDSVEIWSFPMKCYRMDFVSKLCP